MGTARPPYPRSCAASQRNAEARIDELGRRRQRWKPVRGETRAARLDAQHESATGHASWPETLMQGSRMNRRCPLGNTETCPMLWRFSANYTHLYQSNLPRRSLAAFGYKAARTCLTSVTPMPLEYLGSRNIGRCHEIMALLRFWCHQFPHILSSTCSH